MLSVLNENNVRSMIIYVAERVIENRPLKLLEAGGVKLYDADINSYCTCMEMGGFSISVLKLDDELRKYYDAPCYCPFYSKEGR